MKKKFLKYLFILEFFASFSAQAAKLETVAGPTLIGNKVTVCTSNEASGQNSCLTKELPFQDETRGILIPTKPINNATSSWYAIGDSTVQFCSVNIPKKIFACAEVKGLYSALDSAPKIRRQKLSDLFGAASPEIKLAVKTVSKKLSKTSNAIRDDQYSTQSFEDVDDCYHCDGSDAGGGGGEEIPIVEIPGTPEGGGDEPGGGSNWGSGPSVEPPGAGPTESKQRALCTSSAYMAWLLEDAVCKSIRNPVVRSQCNDYNWREYTTSLEMCREIP